MDVRQRIGDMLNRVALRHDEFIIERKGKPLAALVPVERLEQMRRFARRHALEFMDRQQPSALTATQAAQLAGDAKRWARGASKSKRKNKYAVIHVLLDAHVYVSAAVRAEGPPGQIIDRFLRGEAFEIVMSPTIVDEVLRALNYPKVRKYIRRGLDPELWFEDIVILSHLVAGEHEFAGASKDPDDDKYIAAAIEGRARFVVAGDSDLLDLKEYDGIRIVSPRAFLDRLDRLDVE